MLFGANKCLLIILIKHTDVFMFNCIGNKMLLYGYK